MRRAITLVQFHGENHLRVLTDSSVAIDKQKEDFKKLQRGDREHPEYERIELWTSSNCAKSHKFRKPAGKAVLPDVPGDNGPSPDAPASEPEKPAAENANAGADEQTTKTPKGNAKKSPKS